ncbi:hypothetical protein CEXT_688351, partial [Caerostris extrusa]
LSIWEISKPGAIRLPVADEPLLVSSEAPQTSACSGRAIKNK